MPLFVYVCVCVCVHVHLRVPAGDRHVPFQQTPSFSFVTFTKATELPDVGAAASADRGTARGTAAPYQAPVKHNGAARANNGSTTRRFAMAQLKWWLVSDQLLPQVSVTKKHKDMA